jgi:hypothetical protein
MGINNIHVWEDGEVITHTDLNSIALGISQELESGMGAVGGGSGVAWPLVAQGDLNMNGFDIIDFTASAGVIHVNSENNLAAALASAITGSVLVLDPGEISAVTASDIPIISGVSNITIIGYGKATNVVVGGAMSRAGITFDDTCSDITLYNVYFSGGTTGKPAVLFDGTSNAKSIRCVYNTPIGVVLGQTEACAGADVSKNDFNNCEIGVRAYGIEDSSISDNTFTTCDETIKLPGTAENGMRGCRILNNRAIAATGALGISGVYVGASATSYSHNTISGNTQQGSTGLFINLQGYTSNVVNGNLSDDGSATVTGYLNQITNNVFGSMTESAGTGNELRENTVIGNTVITSHYSVVTGNTFGSVTITSYPEY